MTSERFKLIPAVFLVLRRDNEALLLRRKNAVYQDGKFSLIAGHVDGDELATEALARETKEEAGVSVKVEDMRFVHASHRLTRNDPGQERIDLFFEAWSWEGEPVVMEPEKCSELSWYPIDNLPSDTIPYIKLVLRDVLSAIHYSEYVNEPEQ